MKYKDNVRYFFVKVRNHNFCNQSRAAKLINTICLTEINRSRSDSHYSRFATFEGFARLLFFKLKKEGFAISNDSQL